MTFSAGRAVIEVREERLVDEGVALDLLPAVELDDWLEALVGAGAQVDARLVSVEWAVPERIARIALAAAVDRARVLEAAAHAVVSRCVVIDAVGGPIRVQGTAAAAGVVEELAAALDRAALESSAA